MTQEIKVGDVVRSCDSTSRMDCYIEGVVRDIVTEIDGERFDCPRYKIEVTKDVVQGEVLPNDASRVGTLVYPPVNGTATLFGGVTEYVQLVESEVEKQEREMRETFEAVKKETVEEREEQRREQEREERAAARRAERIARLTEKFSISAGTVCTVLKKNRRFDKDTERTVYAGMSVVTLARRLGIDEADVRDFNQFLDDVLKRQDRHIADDYGHRGYTDFYRYRDDAELALIALKFELKERAELVVEGLEKQVGVQKMEDERSTFIVTAGGRKLRLKIDGFARPEENRIEYSVNFPGGHTFNDVRPENIPALVAVTAAYYDAAQALASK